MRPKKLTMVAFGPYGEEQIIEFDKLIDTNIFLIHGPTGSGKTTILDAMCYALYGYTNGGERSAEHMRSKFAKPEQGAEVELIFTVHGQDYKVTRSPRFERPKLKGEGMTEQLPKVNLSKWDGESFITLTEKQIDVDKKISELLRFNIDQFRQVIMIAQNKFRELLTVDSKERQKILQDIFETGIYEQVEQKLDHINSKLAEEIKIQEVMYTTILNNIDPEEHKVLKQYIETKVLKNAPQVTEILKDICVTKESDKLLLNDELNQIKEKIDKLQEKLVIQTEKYNASVEKKKVQGEIEEIKNKEEYYLSLKQHVEWSQKAIKIMPLEESIEEIQTNITNNTEVIKEIQTKLEQAKQNLESLQEQKEESKLQIPYIEELKKQYSILETYLSKVEELAENKKTRQQLEKDICQQKELIEHKVNQIKKGNNYIQEAEKKIEHKDELSKKLNERTLYRQQVEQVLLLKQDIEIKQKDLNDTRNQYTSVSKDLTELRQRQEGLIREYDNLFSSWLQNQAGEIAKVLQDDIPCPVCGSLSHPIKATLTHIKVDLEEIRKKEADKLEINGSIRQKEEEQSNIKEMGMRLAKEVEKLVGRAKELVPEYEMLEEEVKLAEEGAIATLKHEIEQINKDQKQMHFYKQKVNDLEQEKIQLEEVLKNKQIMLGQTTTKIEEVQKQLPENLHSREALVCKLTDIQNQYTQLEQQQVAINEAFEKVRENQTKLTVSLQEKLSYDEELKKQKEYKINNFSMQLQELGFADKNVYIKAKEFITQIDSLQQDIENYYTNKIVLENTLKELESKTKDFNEEKLVEIKAKYEEALLNKEVGQLANSKLTDYIAKHQKLIGQISELYEKSMQVIHKQHTMGIVSMLAKGKNSKGISFETYIQSSIFEQVLNSANSRLKPMTGSRYELYRAEDRQDRRKRTGLDIAVKDNYVGQTRPVNTLSGGESFMAALALALGLADVIQRLAGATSLDTMFIDEGFGTLDEEALELAIKILLNLGDTGRLVGIISHVKELREQIPARLEIVATNAGSRAEFKI